MTKSTSISLTLRRFVAASAASAFLVRIAAVAGELSKEEYCAAVGRNEYITENIHQNI